MEEFLKYLKQSLTVFGGVLFIAGEYKNSINFLKIMNTIFEILKW